MTAIIPSRLVLALLIAILATVSGTTAQAEDNDRFARLVLFIPTNAEPPENYEARLGSLALRTEAFFARWMKHWERPIERSKIFSRNDDGSIAVAIVKGKLMNANGRAALPEIRTQALRGAASQLGPAANAGTIWWILYDYPGVKGFQGGARGSGGMAINAYPDGTDLIPLDAELASGELVDMAIKGTIHELGHALGLPHIGPRPDVKLGNSLMGPVNKAYWSKTSSDDTRVYLTEAAAAALWKHPVFKNEATPDPAMPAGVTVTGLDTIPSPDGTQTIVKGTLAANVPAHTAVLLDSERGQFGDYWARSYSAPIDKATGTFEVAITAPYPKSTFFLSFCFENGANTADGKTPFQRGSPLEIPHEAK